MSDPIPAGLQKKKNVWRCFPLNHGSICHSPSVAPRKRRQMRQVLGIMVKNLISSWSTLDKSNEPPFLIHCFSGSIAGQLKLLCMYETFSFVWVKESVNDMLGSRSFLTKVLWSSSCNIPYTYIHSYCHREWHRDREDRRRRQKKRNNNILFWWPSTENHKGNKMYGT